MSKFADYYYSFDYGDFGFKTCPHIKQNNQPVIGAANEGSAPGVVTTDGTYMYFPIDGNIWRENIDGSNRTPIFNINPETTPMNIHYRYKYKDLQYNDGYLYCYGSHDSYISAAKLTDSNSLIYSEKNLNIIQTILREDISMIQ